MTKDQKEALGWWNGITYTMKKINLQEKYFGSESLLMHITDDEIIHIWENETLNGKMVKYMRESTPESILASCEKHGCIVEDIVEDQPKPLNFVEEHKKYFKTTPKQQILKDWSESGGYDNVGMDVQESVNDEKFKYVWLDLNTGEFSNSWSEEMESKYGLRGDELVKAAENHLKLIKYQCINEPEFEFSNQMKLR